MGSPRSDRAARIPATVERRTFTAAVLVAALAGYVDAMGYITLGGFFVSFMSGNSTSATVDLVDGRGLGAAVGGVIIVLFVMGVVGGSLLGRAAGSRRRPVVMVSVTMLLMVALVGAGVESTHLVIAPLTVAMGAQNTVFERSDAASISLTYMTGTLVKLGQRIADALTGGPRWEWVRFATLWLGLIAGVVAGAAAHRAVGLAGLWVAVALAAGLAVAFGRGQAESVERQRCR